jgi:BirA family transcriptional regulator, biotin operon repressor / biotin---[acetyl-CoA-carboxylase] ligase
MLDPTSQDPSQPNCEITFDYPSGWFDLQELATRSNCEAIEFHRDCESTNNLALQETSTRTPKLFITDCQTAGRGRGSSQWWAKEGALTFSILIRPTRWSIEKDDWPRVSLVSAIAVRDLLTHFAPTCEVGLKWPNDVHLNQRKVCGILVEPSRVFDDALVIGIGVNVMNSLRNAPQEIKGLATSLVDETDHEFSLTDVLVELLDKLAIRLSQLGSDALNLPEIWSEHCVLAGNRIVLQAADQTVTGRCCGIDNSGAILVENNGETKAWFGGVVRFVD